MHYNLRYSIFDKLVTQLLGQPNPRIRFYSAAVFSYYFSCPPVDTRRPLMKATASNFILSFESLDFEKCFGPEVQ